MYSNNRNLYCTECGENYTGAGCTLYGISDTAHNKQLVTVVIYWVQRKQEERGNSLVDVSTYTYDSVAHGLSLITNM